MKYSNYLIAKPTENGNGFKKGSSYKFIHSRNSCYYAEVLGAIKYVTLPQEGLSEPSAHLWDGHDWDTAGHFIIQGGS